MQREKRKRVRRRQKDEERYVRFALAHRRATRKQICLDRKAQKLNNVRKPTTKIKTNFYNNFLIFIIR